MQQSAAFFVLLSQMRAMRGVVRDPQIYANKLVSDGPEAVQFRKDKTVGAMQQMLAAACVPTTPPAAPSSNARVPALAAQLVDPQQPTERTGLRASTSGAHGLQDPATPPSVPSSSGQDTQSSALTNQLMDMILSLQNQMQEMQWEAASQSQSPLYKQSKQSNKRAAEDTSPSTSTRKDGKKQKKGGKEPSPQSMPDLPYEEPLSSFYILPVALPDDTSPNKDITEGNVEVQSTNDDEELARKEKKKQKKNK